MSTQPIKAKRNGLNFLLPASRKLWHLICPLFFEPHCCLLCQVEVPYSERQDDFISHPAHSSGFCNIKRLRSLKSYVQDRMCLDCISFFETLTETKTVLVNEWGEPAMTCFSTGFYTGPVQETVYQIKYLKRPELACSVSLFMIPPAMALLETVQSSNKENKKDILLVPVPLHRDKLKERTFNQAEELALSLADLLNLNSETTALKRIRPTRPQFGLSRSERRKNVAGAFSASKKLKGKSVILIDDVLTSGATLYECAEAIAAAGGTVIGGLTLARARWQTREHLESTAVPPEHSLKNCSKRPCTP